MFGNRFFFAKLAGAVALFAGACALCGTLGKNINPAIAHARLVGDRHDGAALWIPRTVVLSVASDSFLIQQDGDPVRVLGKTEGIAAGDAVELSGVFQASDGSLRLQRVRKAADAPRGRVLAEVVSLLALLGVLVLFLRCFAVRRSLLEIPWPTS